MPNACDGRNNNSYRTQILNARAFTTLEEVRDLNEAWRRRYNTERTHDSFGSGAAAFQ